MPTRKDAMRVVDIDRGFSRTMRRLYRLATRNPRLQVGWWQEDDAEAADRAVYNEVAGLTGNASKIPPRPVLAPYLDEHGDDISRVIVDKLRRENLLGRKTAQRVLKDVGEGVVNDVRIRIGLYGQYGKINKNNAPSTIARKGMDRPLVETGRMRDALTFKVEQ